jgi:hypothetical protein
LTGEGEVELLGGEGLELRLVYATHLQQPLEELVGLFTDGG